MKLRNLEQKARSLGHLRKLILYLYLELLYLEFFSISNKNLSPLQLFLSLSRNFFPSMGAFTQQTKQKCLILESSNVNKTLEFENSIAIKVVRNKISVEEIIDPFQRRTRADENTYHKF